jgi:Fe-Mn family superoxide dismutase
MEHSLMDLPFGLSALEPYISKETLEYHHGKHHAGYVNKLNGLIKNTKYETMELKEIIKSSEGGIFNNSAQVYNHNFYFEGICEMKTTPSEAFTDAIVDNFDSMAHFKEMFLDAAASLFGSGWAWLCKDAEGQLVIKSYSNAGNPLLDGLTPLLTCDVWEHAYYIDYRNARAEYLQKWWELINWDFVSANFQNT